jgi:hypothetical protein
MQTIDSYVPTKGGVGRTHESSRRPTKGVGYGNIYRKTLRTGLFRRRMIMCTFHRYTVSLLRLRPFNSMRSFSPCTDGKLESHIAGQLSPSALPLRYFPAVRRQLQRPPPTHIRPYPHRRKTSPHTKVPPVDMNICEEYQALKRNIRLAEGEILTLVYK